MSYSGRARNPFVVLRPLAHTACCARSGPSIACVPARRPASSAGSEVDRGHHSRDRDGCRRLVPRPRRAKIPATAGRPSRDRTPGDPTEAGGRRCGSRWARSAGRWSRSPSSGGRAGADQGRRAGGRDPPLRRGVRRRRHRPRLRRRVPVLRGRRRGDVRLRRRPAARPLPRRRLEPGRAVPQRESGRRRAAVREGVRPGHRPHERHRRLPDRRRRRRPDRPRGPAERRERAPARPRRLPVRARERDLGLRRRRRLDRRVQRDVGGFGRPADARVRQLPRPREGPGPVRVRRQRARAARDGRPRPTRRRSRSRRATARCPSCSATGTARATPTSAWPTTATTTSTARSSCGASSPASPRACTPRADGWRRLGDLGHGHRELRRHRRRPARGVPDEPGRQQAPDAGERDRPADLPGHRDRRGRDRDASVHGRRSRCPRRHGIPSSRTSTTTGSSTCSSPRATSRRSRTSPRGTRATC